MNDQLPEYLSRRLQQPLPGPSAQYKMASLRRMEELGLLPAPPPDAKVACVLNLLHWQEGRWHTVLIQRSANPRDRHGGQVSFPGGRYEPSDGSLAEVALRETEEEVGIPASKIRVLGQLTHLYIPVSNFLVHPFVGVLEGLPSFQPQAGEVESILTPALRLFQQAENKKTTDLTIGSGLTLKNVPYFDVDGCMVWGATAMILSEFLEILDFHPQFPS